MELGPAPQVGRRGLTAVVVQVGQDDPGLLAHKAARQGGSYPAESAGDQNNLAGVGHGYRFSRFWARQSAGGVAKSGGS
jgi:hypothetical protein